jgi:hypothetical protein
MTASIPTTPVRLSREAFDRAYDAALAAGWDGRAAYDAVACMQASGVTASEIVRLFDDCMRRIQ